jgi:DNA-binding transcriptional regulator YiaG
MSSYNYLVYQTKNADGKIVSSHIQVSDGTWSLNYFDPDPLTPEDVKRFRREQGLTQEALAGLCNMSIDGIRSWEGGRSKIPGHWRLHFAAIVAGLAPWPYARPNQSTLSKLPPL